MADCNKWVSVDNAWLHRGDPFWPVTDALADTVTTLDGAVDALPNGVTVVPAVPVADEPVVVRK